MTEAALTVCFFLFVMATVGAALLAFRWRTLAKPVEVEAELPPGEEDAGLKHRLRKSMMYIGAIAPEGKGKARTLREQLVAAGYRHPSAVTVFQGIRLVVAISGVIVFWWLGLLTRDSLEVAGLLALCGGGFFYLLPDRLLEMKVSGRIARIEEALPAALDLMVLEIEAGQGLDVAIGETGRELQGLYDDLAAELGFVLLELRAGRTRADVLFELGRRTGSEELRKLSRVLLDSDRFGTSLGAALRTHARYLQTHRRLAAQETARKLGVKLVFPVFFLIMPSVFVITLGPALLQIVENLRPLMEGR